ncbi:HAD family hydrolase [Afifella marina]|uniref:HAD family hydrolase n=1 Tax=Afifella marina TaxID=1080 RepID=UPI00244EADF4|nr:HAD-IA family hydrolase [Afifella marina]
MDLDGTVMNSDPYHFEAFQKTCDKYGAKIDEEIFRTRISGHTNEEICAELFPHIDKSRHAEIADEKEALFRELLERGAEPIAGLPELLSRARAKNWGLALVTNAPIANQQAILAGVGLSDAFDILISADELPRGKPDPLPYRTAMERLGVAPENSVAFEDAIPGLTAAVRAGVPTIGLRTSLAEETLLQAGAALAIRDYHDPRLRPFLLSHIEG